jgi:hypothetical protein
MIEKQECLDCNRSLDDCTCIEDTIELPNQALIDAAERFSENHSIYDSAKDDTEYGFINGAKWQQERSYSEEEVKNIMAETWIQCVGNDGNNFTENRNKILEQFKKK